MRPVFSIPDLVDCHEAYAKLGSYLRAAPFSLKRSDLLHFISSQFGKVGILSNVTRRLRLSQELNRMAVIFATGDNFKVFGPCVMSYSVFMVYFHDFWYRSNKGGNHKSMNSEKWSSELQPHARISRIITCSLQDVPTQAAHSAKVADIASRIAFYWLPNFARIVFRHLDNLLSRCLEPVAALVRCIGSFLFYQHVSMAASGEC